MQWEFTTSEDIMEVDQCLDQQGALFCSIAGDMDGKLVETQAVIGL